MKTKSRLFVALSTVLIGAGSVQAAERINLSHSPNTINLTNSASQKASASLRQKLGLNDRYTFTQLASKSDLRGNLHTRYQQLYKNIPVWAQQVVTHGSANSQDLALSGQVQSLIENDIGDKVTPKINQDSVMNLAISKLRSKIGKDASINRKSADLYVYIDQKFGKAHLAWHIELLADGQNGQPNRQMLIIDANDGRLLDSWDALMHIDVTGPGGNTKTGKYLYGTDFPALSGSDDGAGTCTLENDNVRAVSLNNTWDNTDNTPYAFTCPENTFQEINGAFSPINDAFYFGNVTFDMYSDWYETTPLPFQLSMKVHYGTDYENAFWDGQAMTFGDGASFFYPLVDINVSVHEISHGFTQFNANLIYSGESGGMNEAFSDIAGEAGEFYSRGEVDWFVGKDIMKDGDGLRFFEDPTQDGRSIGHYSDYYPGIDVHFSSGIFNRAYYLLSNTEGWDPHKAFDVFVLANQAYWMPDSSFDDGACGVISAANDLGYDWGDVYTAMAQVGSACSGNGIDEDKDGMSDIGELVIGFDPTNPADANGDFDNDGLSNRVEMNAGFDAKDRDSDNDGLSDSDEYLSLGTSLVNTDTDGDGMDDGWEVTYGFNPINDADASEDTDADGVSNLREYSEKTDPTNPDDFTKSGPGFISAYDFEDGQLIPGAAQYPSSDAGFVVSEKYAASGSKSLANEDISDSQWATQELIIDTTDGNISFDLKTSTESGWDYFVVYLDFVAVYITSGENDWQTINIPVTAGTHSLIFSYEKDGSVSSGEDSAWIDNVNYSGLSLDDDGDGMLNGWETFYGLDPADATDADLDADEDGLTNAAEFAAHTDPTNADTDGDGLTDSTEVNGGTTSALNPDSDDDLILDGDEVALGLDPVDAADGLLDLDGDGINNSTEAKYGTKLDDALNLPLMLQLEDIDFNSSLSAKWLTSYGDSWSTEADADGVMKLMAEPISSDKQAKVDYVDVFDNGTLTIGIETDTEENADFLEIWVDGVLQSSFSGASTEEVNIELARGEHTVSFVYNKDFVRTSNKDRVSITNFQFIAPDADSDLDGLTNGEELALGTKLDDQDSDLDGLTDGEEVDKGTNPLAKDTDGDGVSDLNDQYPLDKTKWQDDQGSGSMSFILMLILGLAGLRRKKLQA